MQHGAPVACQSCHSAKTLLIMLHIADAAWTPCGLSKLPYCQDLAHHAANHLSADLVQNGKTAAALAEEYGHANVAALLTTRTDRPSTNRILSSSQASVTPSASPLPSSQGISPLHNLPSQSPSPMHQSSSSHQQSECAPAACSAVATSSSSDTPHAVSYPTIFGAAPAQGLPRPHHMGQLVSEHALASRSHAPSAEEARRLDSSGGDRGHTEAVQADAPALGYVPGALSFIRNKLQVLLLYQTCNRIRAVGCLVHSQNGRCCHYLTKQLSVTVSGIQHMCDQILLPGCVLWSIFLHTCPTVLTCPPPSSLEAMLSQYAT